MSGSQGKAHSSGSSSTTTGLSRFVTSKGLETVTYLLSEVGEVTGLLKEAPQFKPSQGDGVWSWSQEVKPSSIRGRLNIHQIARTLETWGMLSKFAPVLDKVGLKTSIIPVLILMGIYCKY